MAKKVAKFAFNSYVDGNYTQFAKGDVVDCDVFDEGTLKVLLEMGTLVDAEGEKTKKTAEKKESTPEVKEEPTPEAKEAEEEVSTEKASEESKEEVKPGAKKTTRNTRKRK